MRKGKYQLLAHLYFSFTLRFLFMIVMSKDSFWESRRWEVYTNTFLEWCLINLLSKDLCNPCLNWLYFQPLYVMSLESCNLSCPSFIPKPCLLNTCLLYWCSECTVNATPLIILYISIQDLIILSDLLGRSFFNCPLFFFFCFALGLSWNMTIRTLCFNNF